MLTWKNVSKPHRRSDLSDIWIEQCGDSDPSWAEKLPFFVAEVKRIFTAEELRGYFATTTRVGPAATSRPMNSI